GALLERSVTMNESYDRTALRANVRDAAWLTNDAFGARCVFEADTPVLRGAFRSPGSQVRRCGIHPGGGLTRTAERDVPLGVEPGGLPRPRRRVHAARRGRGAAARGVGLRALPAGCRAPLHRRGRRPVRHLDGWRESQ